MGQGLSWRYPPAEHLSALWVVSIGLVGSRPSATGLETSPVRGDVRHLPKCTRRLPQACPGKYLLQDFPKGQSGYERALQSRCSQVNSWNRKFVHMYLCNLHPQSAVKARGIF